jgi:carbon storage regulator
MLILSRHRNEKIMIGHDIELTVVELQGGKVRIGINAPPEITVHRREVYEAIHKITTPPANPPLAGKIKRAARRGIGRREQDGD